MSTIDVSTIEGFDAMTSEQKIAALMAYEIPDRIDMTGFIPKSQFDKTSSELADAKKQLKARMTEDEAAKAKENADRKALEDKYTELLRKSTISEHTARYLAMPGYDEKLARETAEALFDGKMDVVFANQQKANEAHEKKLKADLLKQMPFPGGAGGGNSEKQGDVELARQMGKARATSLKTSDDVLKNYI